jgi:predicted enzyme related to lactoylglutathione lyase
MSKPARPLFQDVAFVIYPVRDISTARNFYQGVLGLTETANWDNQWVEYDIGHGTLAITLADEKHRPGVHGPSVALELSDWPGTLEHLKTAGVPLVNGPFDTPVCQGCIIADPDGNELMLHKKK